MSAKHTATAKDDDKTKVEAKPAMTAKPLKVVKKADLPSTRDVRATVMSGGHAIGAASLPLEGRDTLWSIVDALKKEVNDSKNIPESTKGLQDATLIVLKFGVTGDPVVLTPGWWNYSVKDLESKHGARLDCVVACWQ